MKPLILCVCLVLGGCGAQTKLTDFTQHLNERNCGTKGSVTASAGLTGTQVGGHVEWDCKGAQNVAGANP